MGSGSSVDRFERGDPHGVSLLSIFYASRWHEDVPGSSSPVLLERDVETSRGLCSTMSHMSALKAEHQKPAGLLKPLEVAEWNWEHVTMDFLTHLPRTPRRHDAVWAIVYRLTKSAHFLTVRMTVTLEEFFRLYIREIVQLHGVPVSIVSDRDPRFTTHFWKSFQKAMGTRLTISTTFQPHTNGQSERTIQVLEDMLRGCVLDHKGSWEEHLPLVEFAYNNSYQASI